MARNRAFWIIAAMLAVGVYGSEPRRQLPVTTNEYASADQTLRVGAATPPGCRALKSDEGFPPHDAWIKALPGVEPIPPQSNGLKHPDYRLAASSAVDVERAVAFATSHNVRISIINTGHDYMARNDAPSGLLLDVSRLSGVITHSDWKPRPGGDPPVNPAAVPNVVTPVNGKQAAVTFGAGLVGSKVNELIKESKMFVISGGAPTVALAGGWGQHGGHSPVSSHFGLGVDQFLEFQVVTADGKLKIANKLSNPDLFWALRGGGGGNFGVVTQVTFKAYPQMPILAHVWWINSTKANIAGMLGLTRSSAGLHDAVAYLMSEIPNLIEKGAGGYYYPFPNAYRGVSFLVGQNATEQYAHRLWDPVLNKMKSFDGMSEAVTKTHLFPSYQDFFAKTFADGSRNITKMIQESGLSSLLPLVGIPDAGVFSSKSDGLSAGRVAFDSRLLARKHLESLPSQPARVKRQLGFLTVYAVSGGKAHRPDDETSVNPAWRRAYAHCLTLHMAPFGGSAKALRELAPDTGAYGNEAFYGDSDWKQTFWGSNYGRLSEIKTRYDANMVFWNSPGINADHMEARNGRLCKRDALSKSAGNVAPQSDNQNNANILLSAVRIFGDGISYGGFPVWKQSPFTRPKY